VGLGRPEERKRRKLGGKPTGHGERPSGEIKDHPPKQAATRTAVREPPGIKKEIEILHWGVNS